MFIDPEVFSSICLFLLKKRPKLKGSLTLLILFLCKIYNNITLDLLKPLVLFPKVFGELYATKPTLFARNCVYLLLMCFASSILLEACLLPGLLSWIILLE